MQCFIKHLFVSMSVKQNLFVSVFLHKCLMMLNDVEYTTFKMLVTEMSNYLFVISFQLMFHKTLRYRLARALVLWKPSSPSQYHPLRLSYVPPKESLSLFREQFFALPQGSRFSNLLSTLKSSK